MMFRKIRRDRWCRLVVHHGEQQRALMVERANLGDGWPEERESLTRLIEEKERKLDKLRTKIRTTA